MVFTLPSTAFETFRQSRAHHQHSESEDLTSAQNCSLRVLLDKRTCPRKIADFETIAHDRPDDCLQCDWLPFPCAIRVNRRTAAAAEYRTISFLSDIAGTISASRDASARLAIASTAAARTVQSLSDTAFASAWPLRGSGSPANSRAAAARVGAELLFFHACKASIPYPP